MKLAILFVFIILVIAAYFYWKHLETTGVKEEVEKKIERKVDRLSEKIRNERDEIIKSSKEMFNND